MTVVALFGATGKTGRRVFDGALAAGHQVRALVRDPAKLAFTHERLTVVRGLLSGHVLADAEGHLAVLQQSGLDWTVVRGPMLTDDPGRGRYRTGWVGVDASVRISRDDLADFILTQVDDRSFIGQLPFVSD